MSTQRPRSHSHIVLRSPDEDVLGQVVREARADLRQPKFGPKMDWAAIEEKLMARVATEQAREREVARFNGSRTAWGAMAGLVAAAAALALFVRMPGHEPRTAFDPGRIAPSPTDEGGSTVRAKLGSGEVRVLAPHAPAMPASQGARVTAGTRVETGAASVVFEDVGRVAWMLDEDSRAKVTTGNPLVVDLERGAVEAQVVPVAGGEAFAVDVGDVRVAVHGTHLRVAREGDRVTVDLSEGVASIGAPPRVGSTYGTLVVAPAHVEFSCSSAREKLEVTHDTALLRKPVELASLEASAAPKTLSLSANSAPVAPAHAAAPSAGSVVAAHRETLRAPAAIAIDPRADETIAAAVRACAKDAPHSSDVTVTVSSTLDVTVGDDGLVVAARFTPPLAPEIQNCASLAIYHTRFAGTGAREIPIVLAR